MTAFTLNFDVKSDTAEGAIAAVDALRASSFGQPVSDPATFGPPTARRDDATGRWSVVYPGDAENPAMIVVAAAAAAGGTNGDIVFVTPSAQPGTAPTGPPTGALPPPPPPPMAPVGPWKPSHLVSGRGLPAWESPDPTKPAVATLPPWLEVQVLNEVGAWANVLCLNGWQGWVDARQLIKRAG